MELQNYCFSALVRPAQGFMYPWDIHNGGNLEQSMVDSCLESGMILFQVGLSVIVRSFNHVNVGYMIYK